MNKHLKYLSYVIRHKWFVLLACWRRGLYWQGIVHDWSKFLPSEWRPYAEFFYGEKFSEEEMSRAFSLGIVLKSQTVKHLEFDAAWLAHQHRSPHHWQHWVLREDSGGTKILPMPRRYMLEMLADWEGAGRAITGKNDTPAWYARNRARIQLHPSTRLLVDDALGYIEETPLF